MRCWAFPVFAWRRTTTTSSAGAITDWPDGFFDQSQDEAERILRREDGVRSVVFESARPLGVAQQKSLNVFLKSGDVISHRTDPRLIAGVRILIDDEKHCISTLTNLLETWFPEVTILATCNESIKAYELIQLHKPDFIFLDIEMPWLNGFDLLSKFDQLYFDVIFTTAYDSYAIKAIKYSALEPTRWLVCCK